MEGLIIPCELDRDGTYLSVGCLYRCSGISLTSLPGSVELALSSALFSERELRASIAMTERDVNECHNLYFGGCILRDASVCARGRRDRKDRETCALCTPPCVCATACRCAACAASAAVNRGSCHLTAGLVSEYGIWTRSQPDSARARRCVCQSGQRPEQRAVSEQCAGDDSGEPVRLPARARSCPAAGLRAGEVAPDCRRHSPLPRCRSGHSGHCDRAPAWPLAGLWPRSQPDPLHADCPLPNGDYHHPRRADHRPGSDRRGPTGWRVRLVAAGACRVSS